jgi:hypothetical protein
MNPLPEIRVTAEGKVVAGPFELRPTSKKWRKVRCYWSAYCDGVRLTEAKGTPRLALVAAVRREVNANA